MKLTLSKNQRRAALMLCGAIAAMALLGNQHRLPAGVTFVRTESIPVGLYAHRSPAGDLERGAFYCMPYEAPEWAASRKYVSSGFSLCKLLLGVPGDTVSRTEVGYQICTPEGACQFAGLPLARDSKGREMPEQDYSGVIPEGRIWLGSTVRQGFDSRYLGTFAADRVTKRLFPVLTQS